MKLKTLNVLFGGIICMMLPFVGVFGQTGNSLKEDQKSPLKELQKYEIPDSFYKKLNSQEPDWKLTAFFPPSPIEKPRNDYALKIQKGADKFSLYIFEYETAAKAAESSVLDIAVNARVENYTRFGDEGHVIYDYYDNGGFSSLAYRKGRFVISIHGEDEKTADRFAGYFWESLKNKVLYVSLADKILSAVNTLNKRTTTKQTGKDVYQIIPVEKWEVKQNTFVPLVDSVTGEKLNVLHLRFKSSQTFVHIEITEAESKEKVQKVYEESTSAIAAGFREKTTEFGDRGIIVTNLPRDVSASVGYTKANYYVSVYSGSLNVAKEFAELIESRIVD